MATAFQSSAFQNNAFQIDVINLTIDTHDGARRHYERLKRQATFADKINLRKPTLDIDVPGIKNELARATLTLGGPVHDHAKWLLEDDEEAIVWLLQ